MLLSLKVQKATRENLDQRENLANVARKVQQVKLDQEGQTVYKALKDCKVSKENVGEMESQDLVENEGNKDPLVYLDQSDLKDLLV